MKVKLFISMLNQIIQLSKHEIDTDSLWDINDIKEIILPEMTELLTYALQGKVLFKTNRSHRLLESTYLIKSSDKDLHHTKLGESILKLQNLYNSL